MLPLLEMVSLVLVGALWGCTNPLLLEGSTIVNDYADETKDTADVGDISFLSSVWKSLQKFRNYRVWLPYAVNQSGSLLYYLTLANSDLSMAVPICNGLALVFSILTSYLVVGEERPENPWRVMIGSALIVGGVAVCMVSSESDVDD